MKSIFLSFLILLSSVMAVSAQTEWTVVANGIWKTRIGTPQKVSLLQAAGANPVLPALAKLPERAFPLQQDKIQVSMVNGKCYFRFPLEKGEELYGLGLNFKTYNQRGRILNLHVDHYGGTDNGRTHAPIPFYISSAGYGVLIDAAAYITVYAGTAIRVDADEPPPLKDRNTDKDWQAQPYSDAVEILVPADGAEAYVFAGATMLEVVQRYNLFSGGGYLPPKWGLGFTQRVPTLYSDFKRVHKSCVDINTWVQGENPCSKKKISIA